MTKPKELKTKSRLGIISPSYYPDKTLLKKTAQYFVNQGYGLKFGSSNFLKHGPFAGKPQDRADDRYLLSLQVARKLGKARIQSAAL